MKKVIFKYLNGLVMVGFAVAFQACNSDDPEPTPTPNPESKPDISVLESKFNNTYDESRVTFTYDDNYVYITTTSEPEHKSMYYETSHPLYEDYDEPGNPDFHNTGIDLAAQNYVWTLPRYPEEETGTKTSNDIEGIGVAVNGVNFFQGGTNDTGILTEVNTFDQYEGHPTPMSSCYHYHLEPIYLTDSLGNDAFLGLLQDGFPVYGPYENGELVSDDDLDEYNGHSHATSEFPDGIYHYHVTDDLPWINGGEFYGVTGTFTY